METTQKTEMEFKFINGITSPDVLDDLPSGTRVRIVNPIIEQTHRDHVVILSDGQFYWLSDDRPLWAGHRFFGPDRPTIEDIEQFRNDPVRVFVESVAAIGPTPTWAEVEALLPFDRIGGSSLRREDYSDIDEWQSTLRKILPALSAIGLRAIETETGYEIKRI